MDEPPGAAERLGNDVVLRVIDAGCGMTADVVAHAFEPFFTTKPRGKGTGLGLATVYGTVSRNGGEVTINSTVGSGTTVTVRLPAADEPVPADSAAGCPPGGGSRRVLLVEDEAALRIGTARVLAEWGYEVLMATDGVEAIEMFDREPSRIDVLVTDIAMPRMRGDQLAGELAKRERHPPVIFMTGYDTGDMAPLHGRLLTKPVAEDALLRAIREVLGD
jgi:CheY-like chemotaxis protein